MALDKPTLETALLDVFTAPADGQTVAELVAKLATAIDEFVKTGEAGGDPVT